MSRLPEPPSIDELRRRATITDREYARLMGSRRMRVYEAAARDELRVLRIGGRISRADGATAGRARLSG